MIEKGLLTHLKANVALVSNRVYAQFLPQDSTFPAITYSTISGVRNYHHSGQSYAEHRIQIDCWAEGYLEAKNVAVQVRTALSGYTGTFDSKSVMSCFLLNETNLYDMDTQLYRVILDFRFAIEE
jgi:hypothetical protein